MTFFCHCTAFHHCTFRFITAHFVHHCMLKQALIDGDGFAYGDGGNDDGCDGSIDDGCYDDNYDYNGDGTLARA